MDGKYNLKAIIAGLIFIIIGIVFVLADIFILKTEKAIWISIGCSLLASGIVVLGQAVLVEVKQPNAAEEWGLEKIYATRAEKTKDSDSKLSRATYQLDVVAFGLKSFRTMHSKKISQLLRKGINVRILTMEPSRDNPFLKQRELEEGEPEGQIRKSIEDLVNWANRLNAQSLSKGKITIRGYKCMTLDFYWRVDDEMYIGPYWYGTGSQQTITYKFKKGKQAFSLYEEYFDKLWSDEENTVVLTN